MPCRYGTSPGHERAEMFEGPACKKLSGGRGRFPYVGILIVPTSSEPSLSWCQAFQQGSHERTGRNIARWGAKREDAQDSLVQAGARPVHRWSVILGGEVRQT